MYFTRSAHPDQASSSLRRTPTPTRTPTRAPTATPTSAPFSTPTAGPTTTVLGTLKIVTSPNVGTGTYGNQLNAVTVVSSNDVWTVDHYGATFYQTLTEHWNGTSWSIISSPNPGTSSDLKAVATITANGVCSLSRSWWQILWDRRSLF